MSSSNNRLFLLLLLLLVFSLFSSAVRSESDSDFSSSAIRLPTDDNNDTICLRSTAPVSCPVSCFRTNPVCGVDGVTYWCGCTEAMCSGTRVAKLGFCEVGNGGNGLLSGQGFLLVHMVWLIVLGFSLLFGFF